MRLLLLFVVVPLVELLLLLQLADITSPLWTFGLVVFTGVLGATLARQQGFGVIRRLQTELQRGQMPTTTLVDALMIFVSGALLITPGILTDLFGFSLLVPAIRRLYRTVAVQWFRHRVRVRSEMRWQGSGETYYWTHYSGDSPKGRESEIIDARVIEGRVVDEGKDGVDDPEQTGETAAADPRRGADEQTR